MHREGSVTLHTASDSLAFHTGTETFLYRKLGAHPCEKYGIRGTRFAVWAPHAQTVKIITSKTGWENPVPLFRCLRDKSVWDNFLPGVGPGDLYRFIITGQDGLTRYKSDPLAFQGELRPGSASVVWAAEPYRWGDMGYRSWNRRTQVLAKPMAIYEVHPGSWKKTWDTGDGFLNYRTLAGQLSEYLNWMGYTHVELIGICEHPYDGSWGYQVTGYYAPTARYGTPDDFRYFVDRMHQAGIGVILDWVPVHFPKDSFALEYFDGTPLYEPEEPCRREYPEWGTHAFDHAKPEVRSFLLSSACFWLREYHIDALRVDAAAAMLYTDFGREERYGNKTGDRENREGRAFMKALSAAVRKETEGFLIAEDSSSEGNITHEPDEGGFGFLLKWNMGWMNDSLRWLAEQPADRSRDHEALAKTSDYAFEENWVLPLSHDEVTHGKRSMAEKPFGTPAEKLACLKAFYAFQFTQPGKKLLFMGQDFAQNSEWSETRGLDWNLSEEPSHRDVLLTVRDLLQVYRRCPVLYADSRNRQTFIWVNRGNAINNVYSYIRRNPWNYNDAILTVLNFSPAEWTDYRIGVPCPGTYTCLFSSCDRQADLLPYLAAQTCGCDSLPYSISCRLRPYEAVIFAFPQG